MPLLGAKLHASEAKNVTTVNNNKKRDNVTTIFSCQLSKDKGIRVASRAVNNTRFKTECKQLIHCESGVKDT